MAVDSDRDPPRREASWDAGTLRASFESRFPDADSAADELASFTEGEMDADEFWEAVAGNLKDRRLRVVFVGDRIPRELRSIVEFLNEQLQLSEVIAVEVTQYADPDGKRVNTRNSWSREGRVVARDRLLKG